MTMKRLADILAHHNAVPITLGFLFLASGTALAASPAVRDAVIGGIATETVGVNNGAIIDTDFDRFDAHMTIVDVTEDAETYDIAYRYQTFGVEGAVWKEMPKDGVLTVAKSALLGNDLKAYATEQLRQVVESELVYLKRAQAAELASGRSESRVATSYRGLAGLAIEMKDVLLPPTPVPVAPIVDVTPVVPAPSVIEQATTTTGLTTAPSEGVPPEIVATTTAATPEATTTPDVAAAPVATDPAAATTNDTQATTTADIGATTDTAASTTDTANQ